MVTIKEFILSCLARLFPVAVLRAVLRAKLFSKSERNALAKASNEAKRATFSADTEKLPPQNLQLEDALRRARATVGKSDSLLVLGLEL